MYKINFILLCAIYVKKITNENRQSNSVQSTSKRKHPVRSGQKSSEKNIYLKVPNGHKNIFRKAKQDQNLREHGQCGDDYNIFCKA